MSKGRKPGYKHNKRTKEKISHALTGGTRNESTREKMRQSKLGTPRSEADRRSIAIGRAFADLESKCLYRFLEMRAEYPGHEAFFDSNRKELLLAMRDIKSEKELQDIRRYIETTPIEDVPQACLQYQYDSGSLYAQEDAMVALVDAAAFLRKSMRTKDENSVSH